MKKPSYILAIDQGTTGSRAFIFNAHGQVVASAYQEFKQHYPKPGWVEHDALEIWKSVEKTIRLAIRNAKIKSTQIVSIGITNQRETVVVWNKKTGRPIHRAIVWQCRRTASRCEALAIHKKFIHQHTGLVLDAYFSATKIEWILNHVHGARQLAARQELACGTIDSWLLWQLTQGKTHATDMTNASRTMLFDIHRREWSAKLAKIFAVPLGILPHVQPSGSVFGHTAAVAGLPKGIPINAIMGDQQAALYGQGCVAQGMMKNTYGTGCFLLLNTGNKPILSHHGLLTTIACDQQGKPVYALEGAVFIGGAVMQWLRDEMRLIPTAAASESMIKGVKDTQGVYIVPAFVGLGAPYWNSSARGIITGLTRGSNAQHVIRAALEAIAYQTKDVVELMVKESGLTLRALAVDGGACKNNFLMQFQADILAARVMRPCMIDTTVAGVAYLSGLTSGMYTPRALTKLHKIDRTFVPKMSTHERHHLYTGWQEAVKRA